MGLNKEIHRIYAVGEANGTPWGWCLWGKFCRSSTEIPYFPPVEIPWDGSFFCSCPNLNRGKAVQRLSLWYGASLVGPLCYTYNPTLGLFSHTVKHTTSDDNQIRCNTQHKQTINSTTMVVETPAPLAAWIWWIHAAWGAGGLAHIFSEAADKRFC